MLRPLAGGIARSLYTGSPSNYLSSTCNYHSTLSICQDAYGSDKAYDRQVSASKPTPNFLLLHNRCCCFMLHDHIAGAEGNKISIRIWFGRIKELLRLQTLKCSLTNISVMKLCLHVPCNRQMINQQSALRTFLFSLLLLALE